MLAFSSQHHCSQEQPHRAASMAVDSKSCLLTKLIHFYLWCSSLVENATVFSLSFIWCIYNTTSRPNLKQKGMLLLKSLWKLMTVSYFDLQFAVTFCINEGQMQGRYMTTSATVYDSYVDVDLKSNNDRFVLLKHRDTLSFTATSLLQSCNLFGFQMALEYSLAWLLCISTKHAGLFTWKICSQPSLLISSC